MEIGFLTIREAWRSRCQKGWFLARRFSLACRRWLLTVSWHGHFSVWAETHTLVSSSCKDIRPIWLQPHPYHLPGGPRTLRKEPACQCRRHKRCMHIQSLGQEDPLEEGMATHSSILAYRIPWTDKPGRLQSMGSHRVRHNWSDLALMISFSQLPT